jgi:uncharacterized membrane protein
MFHGVRIFQNCHFQSFLEEDNFVSKLSFHRGVELSNGKPCLYACLAPLLSTFIGLLSPSTFGFLQNTLHFRITLLSSYIKLFVICSILACFKHCMTKKNLLKVVQATKVHMFQLKTILFLWY